MAGGNDINNELTLDVSNFTSELDRATKKLDTLNTKLEKLDGKSGKLEKDLQGLGSNAKQASDKLGAVTQNLDGLAGGLDRVQKATGKAGDGSKRFSGELSDLVKRAQESEAAMASIGDWTKFYGKSLDSLRPKMREITSSQKELASVTEKTTKAEARAMQTGIQNRIKELGEERRLNDSRIQARKQMVSQLEQLERRAETRAAFVRADAYKINANGKEVRRYVGKNAGRHNEIMAEVEAFKREAELARQQRAHISAIVGEMQFRNSELGKALRSEQALLAANKQTLQAQREQREEVTRQKEAKKQAAAQERELAKQVAAEHRAQAKVRAEAEKQAQREILQAQRQAHKEIMQMRRDEMQMHKDMAAFATGAATAGATAQGVHQIADYQNTDARVKALGLSDAEYQRFVEKSAVLSSQEKYLSRTDALQARLDALTAIGYNKEGTIDKTVGSASRNAYILRSLGYENNTMSDITKNLYGFAEARQVMDDPDEVNKSFDIARRMAVASGGKLKIADIETVARNIGDLRQTMSAEGWVRLAAVMEQFKTAGGGNGGGGGVAGVGTIFKMMSLYASGKPLTNGAALNMMGADVLNEVYQDGSAQDFKSTREANAEFMKAVKFAGFKDVKSMSKDPVKFFTGLRGQLLDFMMQDSQFKKFFGADAQKHTYNKEGRMIGADGQVVDQRSQDDTENAAFKRFFSRMGLSNKAIDGMLLTMNRAFAERSYHAADTAMNSKDETQIMADLSDTWTANTNALKASLVDFAVTFEPLLRQLSAIPKALADIIRGLSDFGAANNGVATLALGFLGVKIAMLALSGPMGLLAKSVLFNGGLLKAKVGLDALKAALGGASVEMGKTASSADNLARNTTAAGTAAGNGIAGGINNGVDRANTGVKGGVASITRVLGTLLNWAGWLTLAAMFGWAVGKWISDIEVGGITIGQHMQNLFNDIFSGWDMMIVNMRGAWQTFLSVFGAQNDAVRREIAQTKQQIREQNEEMKIRGGADRDNYNTKKYIQSVTSQLEAQGVTNYNAKDMVGKQVTLNGEKVTLTKADVQNIAEIFTHKNRYDSTDYYTKGGHVAGPKLVGTDLGGKAIAGYNDALHGTRTPPKEKVHTDLPSSMKPGTNANIRAPELPNAIGSGAKGSDRASGSRSDFIPQSAYDVSIAALKGQSSKDVSKIAELQGIPANYNWLAKQAFIKEWMSGKLDDGRDPSARPFAKRAFVKGKAWTEDDIDWEDPKVKAWVKLSEFNQGNDGIQKALEFAAGKIGEASSNMATAIENWNSGTDTPSDTAKAQRDFSKFEAKNPTATQNYAYKSFKGKALASIAGTNYAEMATQLREQNKELNEQFLENEVQASREAEQRRYEAETKKVQAVRQSLDEQIAAIKEAYGEDNALYKELIAMKKDMDDEFTKFLDNQNKLRIKNTYSAHDQIMAKWRDLETNITNTLGSFGERAGLDIWDIINGDQEFDLESYFGDLGRQLSSDVFKSAWGNASKLLMGEGQGTNVVDIFKNIASGSKLDESGWLGRYLNESKDSGGITGKLMNMTESLFGKWFKPSSTDVKDLTGDQATNANTMALQSLTAAILGTTGSNIGFPAFAAGGEIAANDPFSLIGGSELNLEQIASTEGIPTETGNPFSFGLDGIGAQNEAASSGIFETVKNGFNSIFASSGEGGVFSSIKSGFSSLFAKTGGLMTQIGGSFGSIFSSLAPMIGSLFGGSGSGAKIGGALTAGMQGFATGGWLGAAVGGISALFSANGNAFGSSGHIQAFANGGAFTNGLYDSPTLFKFANGGGFSQGVMGEAGPEAVMPLQRDSSGRLGVAVNGSIGGAESSGTNVQINIEVVNNGTNTSEKTTGDKQSDWTNMSNRVKAIVQEEIVKQKRPGGMLN